MNFKNIEELKKLPRRSSEDCLELMHIALENNEKNWFEELAKEKEKLEKLENDLRKELGWKGTIE